MTWLLCPTTDEASSIVQSLLLPKKDIISWDTISVLWKQDMFASFVYRAGNTRRFETKNDIFSASWINIYTLFTLWPQVLTEPSCVRHKKSRSLFIMLRFITEIFFIKVLTLTPRLNSCVCLFFLNKLYFLLSHFRRRYLRVIDSYSNPVP